MSEATTTDLERSDAWCRRLALGHYENFPVGSVLIPKPLRKHFYAVYAFSRIADDIADEGTATVEERLAQLKDLETMVLRMAPRLRGDDEKKGRDDEEVLDPGVHGDDEDVRAPLTAHRAPRTAHRAPHTELEPALARTIRDLSLPVQPFLDLLEAFRRDVLFTPPQNMDDLLDYCRYSANPVGELVLRICGAYSDEAKRYSDDVCTALQLVNFTQDISVDRPRGRHYITEATPLNEVLHLTETLFNRGRALTSCSSVKRPKVFGLRFLVLELGLIMSAGRRILHKCRLLGTQLEQERPHLTPLDYLFILARV
jgi:phytoene/squalene synthetase